MDEVKLEERQCFKDGCEKIFAVNLDSPRRYCCQEHDPDRLSFEESRKLRAAKEKPKRDAMIADLRRCYDAGMRGDELAAAVNALGHRNGGALLTKQYLQSVLWYHGISARVRGPGTSPAEPEKEGSTVPKGNALKLVEELKTRRKRKARAKREPRKERRPRKPRKAARRPRAPRAASPELTLLERWQSLFGGMSPDTALVIMGDPGLSRAKKIDMILAASHLG